MLTAAPPSPRLSTRGWGIVDFDWSNAKKVWAAAKPMNCEEMLVEQVKATTRASPGTTVWWAYTYLGMLLYAQGPS